VRYVKYVYRIFFGWGGGDAASPETSGVVGVGDAGNNRRGQRGRQVGRSDGSGRIWLCVATSRLDLSSSPSAAGDVKLVGKGGSRAGSLSEQLCEGRTAMQIPLFSPLGPPRHPRGNIKLEKTSVALLVVSAAGERREGFRSVLFVYLRTNFFRECL